jgi:hypothetical protein
MKRLILAGLASIAAVVTLSGTGCQPTGVGDPCTPEAEYSNSFLGFNYREVSTESADYQCFSRLCLVNHFQGRVSCPYGQDAVGNTDWNTPGGTATAPKGCTTPFINQKVDGQNPAGSGNYKDMTLKATVAAQCVDRRADDAVYCSCRCANLDGKTDDGAVYCACPDGFTCSQLYTSIGGMGNQGLTGAYCIKSGTEYNPTTVCGGGQCNASTGGSGNCGSAQGVTGM